MSHDESDVLWHWGQHSSVSDDEGFLRAMSHDSSDCLDEWNSGTDPTCHTIGDTGADFFLAYRGGLDYLNKVWNVPTSFLSEVYQKMGLSISELEIAGCMAIMFTGAMAEKLGSGLIFEYFGKHAAFLAEEVDLWFMGGIDDMAINTQWKWTSMIQELEGKNITKSDFLFKRDFPDYFKMKPETLLKYQKILGVDMKDLGEKGIEISIPKDQSLQAYANLVEEMKHDLNITKKESKSIVNKKKRKTYEFPSYSNQKDYISTHEYSYFGKSFASGHFTGSESDPIITFVGAPGYSIPGKTQTGAIYLLDDQIDYENPFWVAPEEYSRCGWALETIDINHDQIEDLIVSCPVYGPGGVSNISDYYPKTFYGRIFVFLGRKEKGIMPKPDFSIASKDVDDIFMNLGFYLSKGDCNNDGFDDLLIGSPFSKGSGGDQRGKVHIIQGIDFKSENVTEIFLEDVVSFEIQGNENYQWLGYSIICRDNRVVVGSPGARKNNSIQASGKISAYDLLKSNKSNVSLLWEIISTDPQAKFGISLALDDKNEVLAVGASSFLSENDYIHAGKVYVYNVSEIKNDEQRLSQSSKAGISGSASYARFGNQMIWHGNDLLVSAPQYGDILGLQREKGALFVFRNANNLDKEIDYEDYDESMYGSVGGGRFGAKIDINYKSGKLLVSSPWSWNSDKRLAGGVHIFDLKQILQK